MISLSVTALSLHHFRNYSSARIESGGQPVVLTGSNGAGKTNILEALSLLTPGRGLRRARLSEVNNQSSGEAWTISAHINGVLGETQIGTAFDAQHTGNTDRRLVRISGNPARSQAELGEHLSMLWLTPQMEQLFYEGASAGRKFLDRLVYSFDSAHAARVNRYEHAMRERNKLLEVGGDSAWLSSLEQSMAVEAFAIGEARLATIDGINKTIQASPLSFPKARLAAQGFVEERLVAGEEAQDALAQALADNRRADAAAGRALIGAHRSELLVTHIEKNMPAETCSTGEQKALLLSIVLAQARAAAARNGYTPMLLLDEVVAHLDPGRRKELFEELLATGAQAWLTGTDALLFSELKGRAGFFYVDNGRIEKQA